MANETAIISNLRTETEAWTEMRNSVERSYNNRDAIEAQFTSIRIVETTSSGFCKETSTVSKEGREKICRHVTKYGPLITKQ